MLRPTIELFLPGVTYDFITIIEGLFVLAAVALALISPGAAAKQFHRIESLLGRLARRQVLSIAIVFFLALTIRLVILPLDPIPVPGIADEFSHLLAGDTVASGRLSNPSHPMWPHFETANVIQQPSYASMEPPAQGLFLALGKVLGGHPWFGVWFSVALACGAICWMLQGWLPPGWALLGGMLAVSRIAAFSYWQDSYWGGAPSALGGALVLGALPRILHHHRIQDALLMGAGAVLLANSRPYEGFVFCVAVGISLLIWIFKKGSPGFSLSLGRIVLPLFLVLAAGAAMTAYYNWCVTGNPLRLPYMLYRDNYKAGGFFLWESARPAPVYHLPILREFFVDWELRIFEDAHTLKGFLNVEALHIRAILGFFLGPLLTAPLVMLPRVLRDKRVRILILVGAVMLLALAPHVWLFPHYAAPVTALFYAIVLQSMRHLRLCPWRGRPTGRFLVRAIPVLCVLMLGVRTAAGIVGLPNPVRPWTWYFTPPGNHLRARLSAQLEAQAGRHLVLVQSRDRHAADHTTWVYNGADIDGAKVVWAWQMDAAEDDKLFRYFKDRQIWFLDPAGKLVKVQPSAEPSTSELNSPAR
jgi:hypothetical protein